MKIDALIVEDDPVVSSELQELLKRHLPQSNFTKVGSIEEIESIVKEGPRKGTRYDVIIVDLKITATGREQTFNDLPGRLRVSFPDASVTVFSANVSQSALHELTSTGDIHVIEKPRIQDMLEAVMRDLGKTLVSRLRASVGHSRGMPGPTHSRGGHQGGCSTVHFDRVLHDILSVYKDLPGDIKGAIQNYVTIKEDDRKLYVDIPRGA